MNIISSGLSASILREQPFANFSFSRWQSVLVITLVGVLAGLDPRTTAQQPGLPESAVMSLGQAIGFSVVLIWVCFLVCVGVLRWWLRRGSRWTGEGDLFNLVAASWFVTDALVACLMILGVPAAVGLVVWMFSVWVAANAISSAIPRASLGYAIGGVCISIVLMLLVMFAGSIAMTLFLMGGLPPSSSGAPMGAG